MFLLPAHLLFVGSHKGVLRGIYAIVYSKSTRIFQTKAGLDKVLEAAVKSVQVLFQIRIEEREGSPVVIQCHSNSNWVHCDS